MYNKITIFNFLTSVLTNVLTNFFLVYRPWLYPISKYKKKIIITIIIIIMMTLGHFFNLRKKKMTLTFLEFNL